MTWLYQTTLIESLPEDCVGFVYIITNNITDKKYIGKKLAKFAKTTQKTIKLKNGTKKKKKIRSKVDSDWRDYYGSSPELKKDIEQLGRKNDDMTLIVRMGKIAELIDEYKKIITNKGKI